MPVGGGGGFSGWCTSRCWHRAACSAVNGSKWMGGRAHDRPGASPLGVPAAVCWGRGWVRPDCCCLAPVVERTLYQHLLGAEADPFRGVRCLRHRTGEER